MFFYSQRNNFVAARQRHRPGIGCGLPGCACRVAKPRLDSTAGVFSAENLGEETLQAQIGQALVRILRRTITLATDPAQLRMYEQFFCLAGDRQTLR